MRLHSISRPEFRSKASERFYPEQLSIAPDALFETQTLVASALNFGHETPEFANPRNGVSIDAGEIAKLCYHC